MTTTAEPRKDRRTPQAAGPFHDLVGPGRRRSDHPLVVGTIVLCLGLIALSSIVQIAATLWAGAQVQLMVEREQNRVLETSGIRDTIILNAQVQATVLRRLCLNVAKTDNDRADCMTITPPVTPKGGADH